MYVSSHREMGITVVAYYENNYVSVDIYDVSGDDTMVVDYTFTTKDEGINDGDVLLYAWIVGGEYGEGQWVELSCYENNQEYYLYGIDDDAEEIVIVRLSEDPTAEDDLDSEKVLHISDVIGLASNKTTFTFHLNGWGE